VCSLLAYVVYFFYCPPACSHWRKRQDDKPVESDLRQLKFELRAFLSDQFVVKPKETHQSAPSTPPKAPKSNIPGPVIIEPTEVGLSGEMRNYLLVFLSRIGEEAHVKNWQSSDDGQSFENFSSGLRIYYAPGRELALPRIQRNGPFGITAKQPVSDGDIVVEWKKPYPIEAYRIDNRLFDELAADTGIECVVDIDTYSTIARFFSEWQQFTHPYARVLCRVLMVAAAILSVSVIAIRIVLFLYSSFSGG